MDQSSYRSVVPALLVVAGLASAPGCVGVDMSLEEEPISVSADGAELSLEWLIYDQGELVSCIDAGAVEIEVAVLAENEERQRISCFGGYAVIDGLSEGLSFVEVSLVDPQGDRIVTTEVGEIDMKANTTNPLGAVELGL